MAEFYSARGEPKSRRFRGLLLHRRSQRDEHGHFIVAHDMFNHDGLTPDGIAEAFIEFSKKEGLSFFL